MSTFRELGRPEWERGRRSSAAAQIYHRALQRFTCPRQTAIAQEFAGELRRYSEELHELVRARLRLEATGDRVAALELPVWTGTRRAGRSRYACNG